MERSSFTLLYSSFLKEAKCCLQIILDVPTVGGRLMLVDMAGSENIEQAGQTGLEAKMQVRFHFLLLNSLLLSLLLDVLLTLILNVSYW